jgi:sugar lactone lactonase YvrE
LRRITAHTYNATGLFAVIALLSFLFYGCGKKEKGVPELKFSSVTDIHIPPAGSKIPAPRSLTTGSNDKLIVLDDAGRVLIYDRSGKLVKQWWMPDYSIGRPEGVCELKDGRIAVTDTHYSRVVIFKSDGSVDKIFGKKGKAGGEIGNPVGVSEAPDRSIYICEYGLQDRVQQLTTDGKFIRAIGCSGVGAGEFQRPSGVIFRNGKLYVVDAVNNRIQLFSEKGKFIKSITVKPDFYLPYDMKFDKKGNMYVVEYGNNCITKLNRDGKLIGRYKPLTNRFQTPWGITVDTKGVVYVADTGNRRIVRLEK